MMSGTFELTKEARDEALPSIRQSTDIYQAPFLCLADKTEVVFSHGAYSLAGTRHIKQ